MDPTESLTRHAAAVRRIAVALAGRDADDVEQEVRLAALLAGDGRSSGAWRRWMHGVARNVASTQRRQAARRRYREEDCARAEALPSASDRASRLELEARLIELVRALPATQSEVLFLRFWEGLPPRAIAERLSLDIEAVRTRQKRALATLRKELDGNTLGGRDAWLGALLGVSFKPTPAVAASVVLASGIVMKPLIASVAAALLVALALWTRDAAEPEPGTAVEGVVASADDPPQATLSPAPTPPRESIEGRPTTATVRGVVVDVAPYGSRVDAPPAVGVDVRVTWFLIGLGEGESSPHSTTDEEGRFELEVPLDGRAARTITVRAAADGDHREARVELRVEAGGSREVRLERHVHGALSGVVVDPNGEPLVGVPVELRSYEGERKDARETDIDGRFRFAGAADVGGLVALRGGWRMVAPCRPRAVDGGEWEEVRIVMVPSGSLDIRVVDGHGVPIPGVPIRVELATGEPLSELRPRFSLGDNTDRGRTDEEGVMEFEAVWADRALRVQAVFDGATAWLTRERAGRALREGALGSLPIVVAPGEHASLTVRVEGLLRLEGLVVDPDGTPHAGAHLRLSTDVADSEALGFVDFMATADEEGRFALELRALEPFAALATSRATLAASSAESPFFRWRNDDEPFARSVAVDLASPPEEDLVILLAATGEISGRLVDASGEPVRGEVRARVHGGSGIQGRLSNGHHPVAHARSNGRFRLAALPPGRYDVIATHADHGRIERLGLRVERDAPVEGLELVFEGPRRATVELVVETPGVEAPEIVVLHGRLEPDVGTDFDAPLLARSSVWADGGWPHDQVNMWYGGQGGRVEGASYQYSLTPIKGMSTTLGVDPGLRWFGAKGRDGEGRRLAPVGTGWVRVGEGEHRIVLRLLPTGTVAARVVELEPTAAWHVALARPGGALLELAVRRELRARTSPLAANARCRLPDVPAGDYELRVGPREVLLSGGAARTEPITVTPGETTKLEL